MTPTPASSRPAVPRSAIRRPAFARRVRRAAPSAALALAALLPLPVVAEPVPGAVVACESLVALRQVAGAPAVGPGAERAGAAARAAGVPGCRSLPPGALGAVEHRAMVGGAPYECLTVAGGGCLWVLP